MSWSRTLKICDAFLTRPGQAGLDIVAVGITPCDPEQMTDPKAFCSYLET